MQATQLPGYVDGVITLSRAGFDPFVVDGRLLDPIAGCDRECE